MIIALLFSTFIISFVVATIVVFFFRKPIDGILDRVIGEDIGRAWARYLQFAIYVVGIGSGARVWQIERYISPQDPKAPVLELTTDRWVLELYQTIIGTLGGVAWLLLVFFVFALIAFVIVRAMEARKPQA